MCVDEYVLDDNAMTVLHHTYAKFANIATLLKRSSKYFRRYNNLKMATAQVPMSHNTPTFGVVFILGGPGAGKGALCSSIASVSLYKMFPVLFDW